MYFNIKRALNLYRPWEQKTFIEIDESFSLSCRMPKTVTKLSSSNVLLTIHKRTMFKKIIKTPLNPALILEQQKLMLNKAIFLHYCNHFKSLTLTQLLNDSVFIQAMNDQINKEPTLHSRAFQLAMEVTYAKRKFTQTALEELYKTDFFIHDMYNINQGLCDQSTIYTCMSTKLIQNYFNFNKEDIIVTSTPLFLTKDTITPEIKQVMDYNKKMTDNTAPDVSIKGRPYDFKDSKELSFNKNHIYILDETFFKLNGERILFKLEQSLKGTIKDSTTELEVIKFSQKFVNILEKQRLQKIPERLQIDVINKFLTKNDIPKNFKSPYIIIKNKVNVENVISITLEKEELENVSLEKGLLDYPKAKKAITSILEKYRDQNLRDTISQATKNSIQLPKIQQEDLD